MERSIFVLGLLFVIVNGQTGLDMLAMSIPGEPGVDYPIFASVESTSFSCDDKVFGGYYADPEMRCQAYHVCLSDPVTGGTYPASFLCPNGTIFQQKIFNCDWWYNVDCSEAESYYGLAVNAFASNPGANGGTAGVAGSCPAVNPLSDAECAGTVSTCWSPGFTDTDCPNFGLCCFDGCQDTCVDDGQSQSGSNILPTSQTSTARPRPRPTPRPVQPRPNPRPQPTSRPVPNPRPQPQPTSRPRPQPSSRPRPQPTSRPRPRPTPRPRPQPTPRPRPEDPFVPVIEAVEIDEEDIEFEGNKNDKEEGYSYPRPVNPLTLPPKSTTPPNGLYQVPFN